MSAPVFEEGVALARLTTIGTGGPARAYRRAATVAELEDVLRGCAGAGARRSRRSGLGSNLLAADDGVDLLVLRLAGELAEARAEGTMLAAGGGATNAVCLHRARAAGARRLRVRLRDPGDGRWGSVDERRRLRQRLERDPRPRARRDRRRNGLAHAGRARALVPALEPPARPGRRGGRVPARAARRERDPRRPSATSSTAARRRSRRRSARSAPCSRTRRASSGPGRCSSAAASRATRSAARSISPKHANFIENAGGATTADCLALMAEARRRAREQFGVELEHEVVLLGDIAVE